MKNSARLRFLGVNGAVNLERMDFDFGIFCERSWVEFVGDPIIVVPRGVQSCGRSCEEHWTLKLLSKWNNDSGKDLRN